MNGDWFRIGNLSISLVHHILIQRAEELSLRHSDCKIFRWVSVYEVLFYQDTDGIYLHYKQYWPAFQKYCKKHGIILSDSAAQFRREKLNGYIKPQYIAGGSKYPRYDYRKKVDGIEASVLNVRPNILKLAES